jgi:hypothetical protein
MRTQMVDPRGFVVVGSLFIVVSGCAQVPAYARGRLAHETMQPSYVTSPGIAHVRAVQEGATGGDASASSGCGCN